MWKTLNTGQRLFAGCLLIILVFLLATVLVSLQMSALKPAAERMRTLSEGIQASLMLGNVIREQYVHQAHLIITRDVEHADHVASAHAATNEWTIRMRTLLTDPEEARLLVQLTGTVETFNRIFARELVPLVRAGDTRKVLEKHDACEKLVSQATAQIDKIVERFSIRFRAAQEEVDARGTRAVTMATSCVVFALVLAIGLAWALTRSITRPIALLIEGTAEVARGNLGKALELDREDEFGQLAQAFNAMTEKVRDRQRQVMESEKLATLGRLAAAVAHELNNPLGIILGYLKTMMKGRRTEDPLMQDLKVLEDEANQCRKIVADLLGLARPTDIDVKELALGDVLEDTVGRLRHQERFARVQMWLEVDSDLKILADAEKLKQVVKNIAANAADAMPAGGPLTIRARKIRVESEQSLGLGWSGPEGIQITFTDTGEGIPSKRQGQVFDPFFTTKTDGTGLGLFICYHIVKAHGGVIELSSVERCGTTVTVMLPALGSEPA